MISIHAFPSDEPAMRLAQALDRPLQAIDVHVFADGETLPRVADVAPHAVLYRSLYAPNGRLIDLLLAADAMRRSGAGNLTLVTPYLPYMRQDTIFHAGEPLSRDVILPLLTQAFDAIVTLDPHLHRTHTLSASFPQTRWLVLSGAGIIGRALGSEKKQVFDHVIGPDGESRQWGETVGQALGAPSWTFKKTRGIDRRVSLTPPVNAAAKNARVLLVDDVCTSGGTLAEAARQLKQLGAAHIEVALTHALFDAEVAALLTANGIARVRSCDTCEHPTNAFHIADTIAAALKQEIIP